MPGSIRETAAAVAAGELSAVSVVQEALEASRRAQPELNAFTHIDTEAALRAASAVDQAAARGEDPGPLAGTPIAVKDLIDQAGRPNTRGSGAPPVVPEATAPCIQRLESAGAVVVGRTGLHEYAFGFSSENHWHGPVRNPWDTALSPGGSSGGSGTAVAAGLVTAALGTDTGGSIRVPAALCGIVGLKVTHGRIPLRGVFPLAPTLDTVGPLARSVADCAALYAALAGDDPTDPWSLPMPVDPPRAAASLANITAAVPHPWVDSAVSPVQREAFSAFLDGLSDAGARIVDVDTDALGPSRHATSGLYFEVAGIHRRRFSQDPDQYGPEVRSRLADAMEVTGDAYLDALEWRRGALAAALRVLSSADVLVTPTVASMRKVIGEDDIDVSGDAVPYVKALSVFTTPVNHIGLPALAVPLPGTAQPPPSVQLIGAGWSETRLLELGLALEEQGLVATARPPHWQPGEIDTNQTRGA